MDAPTVVSPRYPSRWECDVLLTDGGTAHVRPIRPDDENGLIDLHGRLSDQSRYFRFFTAMPQLLPELARRFTHLDYVDRMALVAELDGRLVAVARYDRDPKQPDEAEVAFTVADDHQGRGLGTILLEHLAAAARETGITRFTADVLATNSRMLGVFRAAGFAEKVEHDGGTVKVFLDLADDEHSLDVIRERERVSTVHSIERLLRPGSIAVVGAGTTPGRVGHEVFRNLLASDFAGPVYPVNAHARSVCRVRAYASVAEIPDQVDLAVIAVPASDVLDVVDQCGAKGVHGLVVLSAGFAEIGPSGAGLQSEMTSRARGHGMRVIGPNCIGVANTASGASFNATFASVEPQPGRLALLSQSGGVGVAVLMEAASRNLGVSTFVSVGNKADVSGNDLLQFWEGDDATSVILLYLESFGNPRRFSRIARRVSRVKPIVAVKSGRSAAGARGGSSHTAAMASPDVAVDALFRQAGVIRVDDLDDLFGVAEILAKQPLPDGSRVAIVTNAGGPGIMAADACTRAGLDVPELQSATQLTLTRIAPRAAAVANPVDLIAAATPQEFGETIEALSATDEVDMIVVVFVPSMVGDAVQVTDAIRHCESTKPVVACFLGSHDVDTGDVPAFPYPEAAARALAKASDYAAWRRRPEGAVPDLQGFDLDRAAEIVDAATEERWLDPVEANKLLAACGIPAAPLTMVTTPEAAAAAADAADAPVALKAFGPGVLHKTDVGGVALDLRTPAEAAAAFTRMRTAIPADAMTGAVVQPMVDGGVEMIVGVVHDPSFGPLVMLGTGGTAVEVVEDRAFRILPLTDVDAAGLVDSIKGVRLLGAHRGAPPKDRAALEDVLLRVAHLADALPQIAELDLNPVVVRADGVVVVDARVRVVASERHPELTVRRLR